MYFSGQTTSSFMIGSRMTGLARLAASWKAWRGGDFVGDFGRVDIVVGAEGQLAGDVDHLETGHDAAVHGFVHAFFDGRNEFLRDDAAFDGVDEFEIVVALDVLRDLLAFGPAASSGLMVRRTWPYWPLPPVCLMYLCLGLGLAERIVSR